MSLGAIHVHANAAPYTAVAVVPPHLVEKWAARSYSNDSGHPRIHGR